MLVRASRSEKRLFIHRFITVLMTSIPLLPLPFTSPSPRAAYPGHYSGLWLLGESHTMPHTVDTCSLRTAWRYSVPDLCSDAERRVPLSAGLLSGVCWLRTTTYQPSQLTTTSHCHFAISILDQANNRCRRSLR